MDFSSKVDAISTTTSPPDTTSPALSPSSETGSETGSEDDSETEKQKKMEDIMYYLPIIK